MSKRHPPRFRSYLATTNSLYLMDYPTLEEARSHQTKARLNGETKMGFRVVGGWIDDPEGERVLEWGDHGYRVEHPTYAVFTGSKNKSQRIHCLDCRANQPPGTRVYSLPGGLSVCLACGERRGYAPPEYPSDRPQSSLGPARREGGNNGASGGAGAQRGPQSEESVSG